MSIGWALSYSMSDQDLVAPRVEVVAAAESYRDRAAELTQSLNGETGEIQSPCRYRLVVDSQLSIIETNGRRSTTVFIDFDSAALRRRVKAGTTDLLVRACGLHKQSHSVTSVIDATAGLGVDTWILAAQGVEVFAFERDPLVGVLLDDALSRARKTGLSPASLISLQCIDARASLLPLAADVVYLDPMFSKGPRKAASGKGMHFLQDWLGEQFESEDQEALFWWARRVSRQRTVVKRGLKAPLMAGVTPTFQISGKTHRFDVYQQG